MICFCREWFAFTVTVVGHRNVSFSEFYFVGHLSQQSTYRMSAFSNHRSILVYKTNLPMTRTAVHDFLLCREILRVLPFLPHQSTCKHRRKIQDFWRCFLLKVIPPLRLLQVLGCGLSKPHIFHIKAKTYSNNSFLICTMLWNSCFQTPLAFTFQITDCLMFPFGAKNAVLASCPHGQLCRPWHKNVSCGP